MSRRKRHRGPYKSGYESRIAKYLADKEIDFSYEEYYLEYYLPVRRARCNACGAEEIEEMHTYTPDFYLPAYDLYIETKGKFTPRDRTKMVAVISQHSDKDIRMLFMRDNWITKSHKKKYSTWCESNNIPFAIGEKVPDEWLSKKRK